MTAQQALDNHPTAKKAHVNEAGEWHFSTPPNDFIAVEILTKGAVSVKDEEELSEQKSLKKSKNK